MSFSATKLALCIARPKLPLVVNQSDPIGHLSKLPSYFIDRKWCETDTRLIQILPYIVVKNADGQVLTYQRPSSGAGEQRLEGKLSLGFGGHMDDPTVFKSCLGDLRTFIYREGARELQEEIGLDYTTGLGLLSAVPKWSAIYHDEWVPNPYSVDVSYFHLGLVGCITLPPGMENSLDLVFEQTEVTNVSWENPDQLRLDAAKVAQYEDWSQKILLNRLY